MRVFWYGGLASVLAILPPLAARTAAPAGCLTNPVYGLLDFWVGEWAVTEDGLQVGINRIERVLDGCAYVEQWAGGSLRGTSLFYYHPARREWKQVWVTSDAMQPGNTKEKHLIAKFPDGGVRFQGDLGPTPDGLFLLDRTTLTPLTDGRVRQVIEVSRDGGASWSTTFNGLYSRTR